MRGRQIAALAMAVLLGAGAVAACGDDGGGGDEVALEDVGDSDGSTTTEGSSETTTLVPGDVAEGCAEFSEAMAGLATSIGATTEVDQSALDAFDDAVAEAPEDIRDDLEVYADTFRQYVEALQDAGVDPASGELDPEDAADLAQLVELFNSEEFLGASETLNEFVTSGCGRGS